MSSDETIYSNDLAGIVVGDTAISDVQGELGLLSYRGIDINDDWDSITRTLSDSASPLVM